MWEVIGIVLTSILAFIILFFYILFKLSDGMRKVANSFLDALKMKDYKSAYDFLSDHIRREVWFENFEEYLYKRYLNEVADHRFGGDFSVAANGSNGEYRTTLILENDSMLPLTLNLMKFGRKWKVYAIDIQVRVMDSLMKDNVSQINQTTGKNKI